MKFTFRLLIGFGIFGELIAFSWHFLVGDVPAVIVVGALAIIVSALILLLMGLFFDHFTHKDWVCSIAVTSDRFGVPHKALALFVSELRILFGLRQLFRRKITSRPDESFGYYKQLRTIVFSVVALVLVEIIVVHLAVPSDTWRLVLAILSIYGLLILVGFYLAMRDNPHTLLEQGILLRHGHRFACFIPWTVISQVTSARPGDGSGVEIDFAGKCRLPVLNEVNTQIHLNDEVLADDLFLGSNTVVSIEFYCDSSSIFMDKVKEKQS